MPTPIFHENVAIITGASSGIGRELAFQLTDQGALLSLGARDLGQLETTAAECQQRGGYAASKHAMKGFFDSLRIELADSGVTVTISYPDFITTGMRDRALGVNSEPLGASPLDEYKVMSTQASVQILVKAMEKRKREDKQTLRAKLAPWIKLITPGLVDNIARKAVHTDE